MVGLRVMALGQGIVLIGLGAWPIASMRTFEMVTGPKHDDWLVRTVGGLCAAVGTGLVAGSGQARTVRPLGVATAATLLAADVVGVRSGRLSRVYLADAVVEGVILAGWAVVSARGRLRRAEPLVRRVLGRTAPPSAARLRRAGPAPADAIAAREDVSALLAEAEAVVGHAWPDGTPPPPVRDALRRLSRAAADLESATRPGAPAITERESRRLMGVAAAADIDAASVKEAAYLVSS